VTFIEHEHFSIADREESLGAQVRSLRTAAGLDQAALAGLAGVSLGAVRNLEQAKGSTLRTVIAVARALGREDWLLGLAPPVSISPIDVLRSRTEPRQRVYRSRRRD
jgi:transcriptional regulator with XRE-family HTH domain